MIHTIIIYGSIYGEVQFPDKFIENTEENIKFVNKYSRQNLSNDSFITIHTFINNNQMYVVLFNNDKMTEFIIKESIAPQKFSKWFNFCFSPYEIIALPIITPVLYKKITFFNLLEFTIRSFAMQIYIININLKLNEGYALDSNKELLFIFSLYDSYSFIEYMKRNKEHDSLLSQMNNLAINS